MSGPMSHVGARHGEGSARGPLPIAVSAPPEVTLTRKQYPGTAAGRGARGNSWRGSMHSGRAGSAELRGGLSREGQTTRQGAGRDGVGVGWGGGGKPLAGAREPYTLTCPSPAPPARRRLRAAAGRARTRGARAPPRQSQPRSFKAGRAPRRNRRCRRAAAMAAPSSGNPPPCSSPWGPLEGGSRLSPSPHFRTPPPALCFPIGERLRVGRPG